VVLGQDPYFNPNQAHGKPDSPYMGCYFYPNMNHLFPRSTNGLGMVIHIGIAKHSWNLDTSPVNIDLTEACICSCILSVLILIITLTATLCIAVLVCRAQLQRVCRSSYTPKVRHMATHSQAAQTHALGIRVQKTLCIF